MGHDCYCKHSYHQHANHSFALLCNDGYLEKLSERIRRLREAAGMSQQALADRCHVSRVAVTKWESGETANVKLHNLLALCKAFGHTADQMLQAELTEQNVIQIDKVLTACEKDHSQSYFEYAKSGRRKSFVDNAIRAAEELTDEGLSIVEAQLQIAIETARRIHGTHPGKKQTAAR